MTASTELVVLYIDDERNNRLVLRHALSDVVQVVLAESGPEALEKLKSDKIDVVLADQRMPQMTGVEVARQVRRTHPDVARWLITAFEEDPEVARALQDGTIQRLVTKPWNREALVNALLNLRLGDEDGSTHRQ